MTSGFDPLGSAAPLIVYVDFKSPYAYLAVEPTLRLEQELGIEADWRPLTLDIPSYLGSARLDERGNVVEQERSAEQWAAVKYAYRDARRYAALQDRVLRGTVKIWDTSLAHIAMLWAKRQGPRRLRAFLEAVYPPFWRRELDLEDRAVVEALLQQAGASVDGFAEHAAGDGRAEHEAMQQAIFDAGIFGVPTFVADGEVFFGREHLPRIEWLLTGRSGPAPDIAYRRLGAPPAEGTARGATVDLAVDFRVPAARLAVEPTLELADRLGFSVRWLPFDGERPTAPPAESPGDDRTTRHLRARAQYREMDALRYASARGAPIAPADRWGDATAAHRGLLHVAAALADGHGPTLDTFVREIFDASHGGDLRLDDAAAIERLIVECGAPSAGFSPVDDDGELARSLETTRRRGVLAAPTYLVDGEPFLGREHLPMIAWLLLGREGTAPI